MLAYNLMMLAIVAVCLATIHLAFDERQRRSVKRCVGNLIASMKKERWVEGNGLRSAFRRFLALRLANGTWHGSRKPRCRD